MSWSYRPALDGLRMLSMYLIVLYHAGVPWLRGSFVAVDLFFILSGFLVTQVLLSEFDRDGRIRLPRFYARRVRRLLPAALVAIVGTALVFLLIASVVRRMAIIGDAQAALLYVANWRYLLQANDYFAADGDASPFLHYWTLSIEEQFYLVFPVIVLLLVRSRRRWALPAGLAVLLGLSVAAQVYWGVVDEIHAYYGTDARVYQLLAGALLAVGMRRVPALTQVSRPVAIAVASSGMLLFLLLTPTSLIDVSQSARGILATIAVVAIIYGLMAAERQPLGWLLARRPIVYLGTITYATYLWHWPIVLVLGEVLIVRPEVLAVLVAVLATAMAAASNELVEAPIRGAKRLDRRSWTVVGAGLSASVVAAMAVVPVVLSSERKPVLATATDAVAADVTSELAAEDAAAQRQGKARPGKRSAAAPADARLTKIPDDIDWKAVEDDRGKTPTCDRQDPDACTVVRGGGKHVVVIGDSHAMMLSEALIALAREHDLTLSMNVVPSCPWQEGLQNTKFGHGLQERCEKARVGWYDDVLPQLDPDVVVLVGRARDDEAEWTQKMSRRDGKKQPLDRATLLTSRATVDAARRTGAQVVLVQQIIAPGDFDPKDCLATAKRAVECAVPMSSVKSLSDDFNASIAAVHDDVTTVDLNPALCPGDPVCAPVVDGRVVWRDRAHFTASYVKSRRAGLWKQLEATDVFAG